MKKSSILALCCLAAFGLSAQTALVKDAQKSFNPGKTTYAKWLATVKPAFTNSESANEAFTYFVPAQKGFENFDYWFTLLRAGQDGVDIPDMANSIVEGFDFAVKVLPLDSLPDAKGKIKPKYSKDIVKMVASHYNDFDNAARYAYNAKDWEGAYNAWDVYFKVLDVPAFAKVITASPDSILAENAYLQGYVASQLERYDDAMRLFDKAIALGAKDKNLFNQAMYIAKISQNPDRMYGYAESGYKALGTSEPLFFQLTIEGKLVDKKYDEAKALLDKGLSEDPKNPVYNIAMGSLLENQGNQDEALKYYRLASQYDPNNGDAYFFIGRVLAEQSDAIAEGAGAGMSESAFKRLEAEQINPLRKQAAEAFEKCYSLSENHNALQYLKNIYYVLGDEANFNRVNNMY